MKLFSLLDWLVGGGRTAECWGSAEEDWEGLEADQEEGRGARLPQQQPQSLGPRPG